MNILVTGGAGFIGSHTVVALAEAGFNPVIVDDFSNSELRVLDGLKKIVGREVTCYQEDCGDPAVLRRIFDREQIAGVIHFAAFKAVGESMAEPLKYYRNNLGTVMALLEVMPEKKIPHLIFSSSCTVYGQPDELPVTESAPFKPPESVYGNTKQIGEEILRDVVSAGMLFKIISLRYFNPVGAHPSALIGELPRGIPNNLVPFIAQTAAGLRSSVTIFGNDYPTTDGTCIRDYIHVMDLAEAHVAALKRLLGLSETSCFDAYNVGAGKGYSVLEVVKMFERINRLTLPYQFGPRRPGDVVAVYADAGKAERDLAWKTKRPMEEAMRDAWNWEKEIGKANK